MQDDRIGIFQKVVGSRYANIRSKNEQQRKSLAEPANHGVVLQSCVHPKIQ